MSVIASPYARRLARERGLKLEGIGGTGPRGRIIARDIEAALSRGSDVESLPDPRLFYDSSRYDEVALTPIGLAMAKRMASSWQEVPHFFVSMDFRAEALRDFRAQVNAFRERSLSWNVFIMRAVALSLMEERGVNVSYAGGSVLRHHHADIGMAVATDHGLMTPILWSVEEKSLDALSDAIADAASRARARKLLPKDYEGGSFGVSNLGMYGVDRFTAIINPPQSAILAVGGLVSSGNGLMMSCALSSDHRVIDGALAARFMRVLRGYIENPSRMFL